MRKVVGALFVTAVLACGTRAQADPMHVGQYSGLDQEQQPRAQDMWSDDSAAAWSRFTSEVQARVSDGRDGESLGAFVSFVRTHRETTGRWEDDDDLRDAPRFLHGVLNGRLKAAKVAKAWERMHGDRKGFGRIGTPAPEVVANPEPASMILLGTGLLGLVGIRRRKGTRD